jgi:hypothetical protein
LEIERKCTLKKTTKSQISFTKLTTKHNQFRYFYKQLTNPTFNHPKPNKPKTIKINQNLIAKISPSCSKRLGRYKVSSSSQVPSSYNNLPATKSQKETNFNTNLDFRCFSITYKNKSPKPSKITKINRI